MSLTQLVAELALHVDARPVPPPPRTIVLPSDDDPVVPATKALGYAEGQSFAIEYSDEAGRPSMRRITVLQIIGGGPDALIYLQAKCHERRAVRTFRIDRIRSCIDYDGEVHEDVPRFLIETFGISMVEATRSAPVETENNWIKVLAKIRHEAVILAALSWSDGATIQQETFAAARYLARVVEHDGTILSDEEVTGIIQHVARLRPSAEAISRAIQDLHRREPRATERFLNAAMEVIDADGRRHPAEMAMLDHICVEILGVSIR